MRLALCHHTGPLNKRTICSNPGPPAVKRKKSQNCTSCSQVNAAFQHRQKPPGIQVKGTLPFEHLEVDFPEMKPHPHYHYLLVIVCMFSGWVEAFHTRTERTSEVARCLLREIVPRFGFPTSIISDNGPAFVADLVQQGSKTFSGNYIQHIGPRVLGWWKEPIGHLKRHSPNGS